MGYYIGEFIAGTDYSKALIPENIYSDFGGLTDEFGNKYCAFALLWDSYYKDFLKLFDITNIEEVSEYMKNNFISKINQGDNNGYKRII